MSSLSVSKGDATLPAKSCAASFLERMMGGGQVLRMIERTRDHNRPSLLRWMFQRGDDRIVCQVDAARLVTVSLTSHGNPVRTLNEKFDDMLQAFERHAQLARQLRDYGWRVASYGR